MRPNGTRLDLCTSVVHVDGGRISVASSPDRQRVLLGVHVTTQVVALVLLALGLTTLVGLAVLSWLERTA